MQLLTTRLHRLHVAHQNLLGLSERPGGAELHDPCVGDTLYVDEPVLFGAIPTLAPEHFVTVPCDRPVVALTGE
jgi:hypothetical protein